MQANHEHQSVPAIDTVREYLETLAESPAAAGAPMRLAAARSLREIDGTDSVVWDPEELQRVADFCSTLTLHAWRNAPAILHPWQLHLAGCLLARKRTSDGEVATKMMVLEVGKGNAKSTTAAMLALYLLVSSPSYVEIHSLATKRDQAHRVVRTAGLFAHGAGIAEPGVGPIKVRHRDIVHMETASTFESLATREKTADGLDGRLYIADECGRYTDDTLGKMLNAMGKGLDVQVLMVTTPGQNRGNSYYQRRDRMEQELRDGSITDDRVPLLYGIDEEDDALDPETWVKANPMLAAGVMPRENLNTLAREATSTVSARSEFTREICCRYDDRDAAFVDLVSWDKCKRDFDPVKLAKGRKVVAAADLSKRHDLTAVQMAIVDDRGDSWFWGHAWTCEHELEQRERAGNAPYRLWAEQGYLTICKGSTIDMEAVRAYLEHWSTVVELWRVYVDPVSGEADTLEEWRRGGLPIVGHRQTIMDMSPPLQKLNTLVRQIDVNELPHVYHGGDPVLRQCARNVRVSYDYHHNPKAEKDKAAGRIDAWIAAVMVVTGIMELSKNPGSPYENSTAI